MPNNAYAGWTPLRNALRKLDFNDTLSVIRAYSAFRSLRTPMPFPSNMEVHREVYTNKHLILPWEMEILAREAIIVCSHHPDMRYTARKWNTFANLINKLHDLNDYISRVWIDETRILQEVTVRMPHLQFKYQTDLPSRASLVRYSQIFGHPQLTPIVQTRLGLSPKQFFTIGAGLWMMYASQFLGMNYPLDDLSLTNITQTDYDRFMYLYSLPMLEMKQRLTERRLDDTFMYQFYTLHSYPIILTELNGRQSYICPVPTLLFWRITSGLYYDLINERGFDQAFGTSFQDYIGRILEKTFNGTGVHIYPEEPDRRPKRADWIIDQPAAFMLIECKTKRLTIGARTTIQDDLELRAQLEKIGDAVVQSYQALEAYKHGLYRPQQYPYSAEKHPFLCVVTLENWRLMGPELEKLRAIVKDKLLGEGIDPEMMQQSPFVLCSVNELEEFAYLLKTHQLTDLVRVYWDDPELSSWTFIGYLYHKYRQELNSYAYVFADGLADVFTLRLNP